MSDETKSVSARLPLHLIDYLDRRAELHKRQGKDSKTRSDQIVIAVQRMQLADLPPEQREEVFEPFAQLLHHDLRGKATHSLRSGHATDLTRQHAPGKGAHEGG